jgi:hypothetical protein
MSRPFPKPKSGASPSRTINHLGDEVVKVLKIWALPLNFPLAVSRKQTHHFGGTEIIVEQPLFILWYNILWRKLQSQ